MERTEDAGGGEKAERPERPKRIDNVERGDRPQRRSYNPNFSADNKFVGGAKPERDFNRWDPAPSDRPRPSYERKPYAGGRPADRPHFDRPHGDRPQHGPGKPYGDKKPYGPKKPFGPKKPGAKKGAGGMEPGAKPDFYPSYSTTDSSKELRLNRFIAMSGKCSRREADELIARGEVMVNGNVVTEMGVKVMPADEIRLRGERLSNERKVYIIINKPKGFVTSLDDPHAEKTVMEIVRNACTERIYPVGRLDKSSVGVLLLTNDGDLTEKLTHPSHNKKKVYQVTLERPLTNMDLQRARDGIDLDDGVIIPDAVDFVKPDNRKEVGIEIHSGRNRIVRRIFEELGYGVHKLDRVYFAGLTKKNLRRGQWRFLSDKEVSMLKSGRYE
jgi:23S rRNA pseudouridine2605 synthase